MYTTEFWKGLGERAAKTFVQVAVTMIIATQGTEAIGVDAGITDVSWLSVLNVTALATVLSVATSFVDSARTSRHAGEEAWQVPDAEDNESWEADDQELYRINQELGNFDSIEDESGPKHASDNRPM